MSYYRLKADFENMFQPERRNRSCSLPREISGYNSGNNFVLVWDKDFHFFTDRQTRARSVGPADRFSYAPAMPFTSRALSVPPLDYLEVTRSRYARYHNMVYNMQWVLANCICRNLQPSWYTYYQEPRSSYYDYTHDYYRPSSIWTDTNTLNKKVISWRTHQLTQGFEWQYKCWYK